MAKETLFEVILPDGVSCRPMFEFLCDINSFSGLLIYIGVGCFINYLIFRFLAKSKFGRFIIATTFVFLFPLMSFVFFKNAHLFYSYQ